MFNIEKSINIALKRAALRGESISHDKLAADAGISKQTLYNIFNRDDAKLSHLQGLAKALGCSIYETFDVEGEDWLSFVKPEDANFLQVPHHGKAPQVKVLEEKNALYEDYIESLKRHINSLERELTMLHSERGENKTSDVKQTG